MGQALRQQEVRHAQVSNPGFVLGGRRARTPQGRRLKAKSGGRASDQRSRGALEACYFAFGDTDVFAIADAPDNMSAAAVSLAVSASGAVHTKTTVLLTPEEMDQATKKSVSYRPPGR